MGGIQFFPGHFATYILKGLLLLDVLPWKSGRLFMCTTKQERYPSIFLWKITDGQGHQESWMFRDLGPLILRGPLKLGLSQFLTGEPLLSYFSNGPFEDGPIKGRSVGPEGKQQSRCYVAHTHTHTLHSLFWIWCSWVLDYFISGYLRPVHIHRGHACRPWLPLCMVTQHAYTVIQSQGLCIAI